MTTDSKQDQEYEVIKPPSTLRSKVREMSPREAAKFDPIKAAEIALQRLSFNFDNWMQDEAKTLAMVWSEIHDNGVDEDRKARLFHAAHDIKGQAATLGYPLVGTAAAAFCRLIEAASDPAELPLTLAGKYVEAIHAMVHENARDDSDSTGAMLVAELEEAGAPFIAAHKSPDEDDDGSDLF